MSAELNEQIEHLNLSIDDLIDRVQELTMALTEQITAKNEALEALAIARAAQETKMVLVRKALADTVDDLEETLQYAPEYFRDKWELGASLPAARAVLRHA